MPRALLSLLVSLALLTGTAFLGAAWAAEPASSTVMSIPGAPGGFMLNAGDLTFPVAVLLGFWMLARALPVALRAWTPTLRVELVHVHPERGDTER